MLEFLNVLSPLKSKVLEFFFNEINLDENLETLLEWVSNENS
jgi:hypothetical protein